MSRVTEPNLDFSDFFISELRAKLYSQTNIKRIIMSQRIKIVVVGAQESGKSCLSNFMAGARDLVGLPYAPTAALRILEFDRKVSAGSSLYEENVSIELWDTSGDTQYQTTWPAIGQDMNGVILVCNPGKERELEFWWKSFVEPSVKRGNLHENCCLILAHRKSTENMNKSQMQIRT